MWLEVAHLTNQRFALYTSQHTLCVESTLVQRRKRWINVKPTLKQCFPPAEIKSLKRGQLGQRKEKWDSWRGKVGQFHVSHPSILEIKGIINRCKWAQAVYEHIYTINVQYVKKWDTNVEKWDTHEEKWDVMSQFSPYMRLRIVPILPMPTRFITHSLT